MNIMLGNLTVEQIEKRSGVIFPEELREFMNANHQDSASNIQPGKWHCFDIPFLIVCGDMETAKKIHKHLAGMSSSFLEPLNIGVPDA